MNILGHAEELINEIQNRLEENERSAEEQVERIRNEIEEHRNAAEEQIERIHSQIQHEAESAEEEVRKLHDALEEHRKTIEEQVEGIHNQLEQNRDNAEEQVERIREQIEQKADTVEEEIERIQEHVKEYRDNAEERIERIREQIEEHREAAENRSERIHVETHTSVEQPTEPESVQSLIERFDAQYNERHATTTISQTYVLNGVEVLKYSGKLLPLSEVDEHYPRSEWLQTFLDKNIVIENLHDYCRYLNARDMLMRIKKKPKVWTSGLFDIPPTENWETYQEAYINQLVNPEKAPHI
ncbi:MAG: hypothetical protein OXI43_21305 [Candidatus Poribacteria bacterium]|nr:hypothetical protein [Candidatus Poribacteria bacterium]